jgi:hypothetical protein
MNPPAKIKKVQPRNLTARAATWVAGNPSSTRLESGVANCFPGLEFDVRTLDARFFPGLFFRITTTPKRPAPGAPPNQQGFRLLYLDYLEDPMLPMTSEEPWVKALIEQYLGPVKEAVSTGRWYLHAIEQGGKRIEMLDEQREFLDGELVWFFVRGIAPDLPVTITLLCRDAPGAGAPIVLTGYRRRYVNTAGVIDGAYRAGELTESMCNPWQHDFRDCGCHYWASNHPDVVFGEVAPGEALPSGDSQDPQQASTYLDWIRDDLSPAGATSADNNVFANRPHQLDHFEINLNWERLRFVVEGREIEATYHPPAQAPSKPYASAEEMIDELEQVLAPMEMTLALEYLYAVSSVRAPEEAPPARWPTLRDDVIAARRFVMLIAIGEMTHLRWANQMLWELAQCGFFPKGRSYRPIVEPGDRIPIGPNRWRPRALRPLTPATLDELIAAERPSGPLDNAYARCVATLEEPRYPRHLYELAVRIDTDGADHYGKLREVRRVLRSYANAPSPPPYLRGIHLGTPYEASEALAEYDAIRRALGAAYTAEAEGEPRRAQEALDAARVNMDRLRVIAERLAANGIGIPFWQEAAAAGSV